MTAVTPDAASAKICPQMLPFLGTSEPTPDCMCRGPRCMMWRWLPADSATDEFQRRGYCGLGGTPQGP